MSYKPDSWYQDDIEPDYRCRECEEKLTTLETASEYLASVVKQLYSKEDLDVGMLESDIDQLCFLLDIKLIDQEMQIQRKKPEYITMWLESPALRQKAQ